MTNVIAPEGSAYPRAVEQLLPHARQLAEQVGGRPSRNLLMREFRIGSDKARAILAELAPVEAPVSPVVATEARPGPRRARRPLRGGRQRPAGRLARRRRRPVEVAAPLPAEATGAPAPAVEPAAAIEAAPVPESPIAAPTVEPPALLAVPEDPGMPAGPAAARTAGRRVRSWPVLLLALGAFVAIWSGWVGLGELTGFGVVHPLPGIVDGFSINSAITLPLGMESYAAYALRVWLSGAVPTRARSFARTSAIGSLLLGALGQVAYHLLVAAGVHSAPWPVTCAVACFPVAVLGMGAALAHLMRDGER